LVVAVFGLSGFTFREAGVTGLNTEEDDRIAFVTNYAVIDKIIHHLGVTFTAKRPPPPARQEELY
jgi:hypothetical protein